MCDASVASSISKTRASIGRGGGDVESFSRIGAILPGLTVGSQLRLRGESRRNFKFDDARAGNDEGFVLSRFRQTTVGF